MEENIRTYNIQLRSNEYNGYCYKNLSDTMTLFINLMNNIMLDFKYLTKTINVTIVTIFPNADNIIKKLKKLLQSGLKNYETNPEITKQIGPDHEPYFR